MSATIQQDVQAPEEEAVASEPDNAAFGELYERYFPELYDFVVRTMGETERAREVVQGAFVETLREFRRQRSPAPLDALLFVAARRIALEALQTSSGTTDSAAQAVLQTWLVEVDPQRFSAGGSVPDEDLAKLVWQLLSAHSAEEYSLLDLNLRRGLQAVALAPLIGIEVDEAAQTLDGLQASVEDWITTALLIHRGSQECTELNAALGQLGANAPSSDLRATVSEHLNSCGQCPAFRSRYPTAAGTFASLAAVPAPEGLKESIWLDMSRSLAPGVEAPSGSALDLPLKLWNAASSKQKAIGGAIAGFFVAVFIALVIVLGPSSGIGIDDPSGFGSATHEIGQPSAENVISVEWTAEADAVAYSVEWDRESKTLPDDIPDLAGSATSVESPELGVGEWYFHLRTQGPEGQWTSTVHLGPFVIQSPDDDSDDPFGTPPASASPPVKPTPTPTPSASSTPTPTPSEEPTPQPTQGGTFPDPDPTLVPNPTQAPLPTFAPTPPPVLPPTSPCPSTITLPEPANPTTSMGPAQTVRQYYLLLNEGRYVEAYSLLTPLLQGSPDFSPFSVWIDGFAGTTIVNPLGVSLVAQGLDYAVVAVEVVAVDIDPSVGELQWYFQGSWVLTTDGVTWFLSEPAVNVSLC
ncbi:MAG: hypothetical protein IH957_11275 [Chloroflexi bacterium]|nr:hypothetical protein [Chloroflexota bacterium]